MTDIKHISYEQPRRSMAIYSHSPFKDWTEQIRLLRFIPQQADPELTRFEIKSFTLGIDCPEFTAISYRWDLSPPTSEIVIDGMLFAVRDSVAALFQELRLRNDLYATEFIWIDAICINQTDVKERNHQVKLMRSIYSTATRVLAWLGPASSGSDYAMAFIERNHLKEASQISRPAFEIIKSLLNREYWTRIWVVQEILMARDVTIMCGSKSLRWACLQTFCNMFQNSLYHHPAGSGRRRLVEEILATGAYILVKEKAGFGTSDSRPLSVLLDYHKFGRFKCSDLRDKVYGLLGVSKERDRIVVDYQKTVPEVYIDVVRSLGTTKDISEKLAQALESITKPNQYRPFLARLLDILNIGNHTVHQMRRFLLPPNQQQSSLQNSEQAEWTTKKFFWEFENNFFWETPSYIISTYSWEKVKMGFSEVPDDFCPQFQMRGPAASIPVPSRVFSPPRRSSANSPLLPVCNLFLPGRNERFSYRNLLKLAIKASEGIFYDILGLLLNDITSIINKKDPTAMNGCEIQFAPKRNRQANLSLDELTMALSRMIKNGDRDALVWQNHTIEYLWDQDEESITKLKKYDSTPLFHKDLTRWEIRIQNALRRLYSKAKSILYLLDQIGMKSEKNKYWLHQLGLIIYDPLSDSIIRQMNIEAPADELYRTSRAISLSWAIRNKARQTSLIELLINSGVDIQQKDALGQTPLSLSIKNGHPDIARMLIKRGADLESKNNAGQTPLFFAASVGDKDTSRLLLDMGATVDPHDNFAQTPLSGAASNGHRPIVKFLLRKGAEVDSRNIFRHTPLSRASLNGHTSVVDLLLDMGAKIESKSISGRTPLSLAAGNGQGAIVVLLLNRGANTHSKSILDETALSYAARSGHQNTTRMLLSKGSSLESRNFLGQTPLSLAAENGHAAVCEVLLRRGADGYSKDASRQTPLFHAVANEHKSVAELLAKYLVHQKHVRTKTISPPI